MHFATVFFVETLTTSIQHLLNVPYALLHRHTHAGSIQTSFPPDEMSEVLKFDSELPSGIYIVG